MKKVKCGMGVEVEEQTRVVNLLNNKSSPITYQILGAPNEQCVKLTKAQLNCVNEQIFKMFGNLERRHSIFKREDDTN